MAPRRATRGGFTIIEMMVSVAVMLVLIALAQPSFESFRQRTALRTSGEHALSFWNQARLESAKRNQLVKVGLVQSNSGKVFCLGAATTNDAADNTPCDCTQANPGSDVCNIARFPGDQSEWRNVVLVGATLGGGASIADIESVVIEPKRTNLMVAGDAGSISLASPAGRWNYKLNLHVDRFGRATLCESTSAVDHLSDFGDSRCAD